MTKAQFIIKRTLTNNKHAKTSEPLNKSQKPAVEFELFVDLAYEEMVFHDILVTDRLPS